MSWKQWLFRQVIPPVLIGKPEEEKEEDIHPCDYCDGRGEIMICADDPRLDGARFAPCTKCGGTGDANYSGEPEDYWPSTRQ